MRSFIEETLIPVCICVVSVAGCSHFLPPADYDPSAERGPTGCEALAMIDDVTDGDDRILTRQGRGGYIYSFKDENGSTVRPSTSAFTPARGGTDGDGFALRIKGKLTGQGEAYAGVGFSFTEPMGGYDASQYKGISFVAKRGKGSVSALRVKVPDSNTEPEAKICKECYNDFGIGFQLTEEWTRYEVSFDDLSQESGWGDPQPPSINVKELYGIQWQVSTKGASFDIWIDEISFVGCD